jgi:hypothetical protein
VNWDIVNQTPRLLYVVGPMHMRAADAAGFGLMMGLVQPTVANVVPAIIIVMCSLAVCVFVTPYTGKRQRPLPIAFAGICLLLLTNASIVTPFVKSLDLQHGANRVII